jgi:hypothetical protein
MKRTFPGEAGKKYPEYIFLTLPGKKAEAIAASAFLLPSASDYS